MQYTYLLIITIILPSAIFMRCMHNIINDIPSLTHLCLKSIIITKKPLSREKETTYNLRLSDCNYFSISPLFKAASKNIAASALLAGYTFKDEEKHFFYQFIKPSQRIIIEQILDNAHLITNKKLKIKNVDSELLKKMNFLCTKAGLIKSKKRKSLIKQRSKQYNKLLSSLIVSQSAEKIENLKNKCITILSKGIDQKTRKQALIHHCLYHSDRIDLCDALPTPTEQDKTEGDKETFSLIKIWKLITDKTNIPDVQKSAELNRLFLFAIDTMNYNLFDTLTKRIDITTQSFLNLMNKAESYKKNFLHLILYDQKKSFIRYAITTLFPRPFMQSKHTLTNDFYEWYVQTKYSFFPRFMYEKYHTCRKHHHKNIKNWRYKIMTHTLKKRILDLMFKKTKKNKSIFNSHDRLFFIMSLLKTKSYDMLMNIVTHSGYKAQSSFKDCDQEKMFSFIMWAINIHIFDQRYSSTNIINMINNTPCLHTSKQLSLFARSLIQKKEYAIARKLFVQYYKKLDPTDSAVTLYEFNFTEDAKNAASYIKLIQEKIPHNTISMNIVMRKLISSNEEYLAVTFAKSSKDLLALYYMYYQEKGLYNTMKIIAPVALEWVKIIFYEPLFD